jgi:GntR family transcriptional regulator
MPIQLSIDLASHIPANRQVVDNLRVLLVEGKLKAGTELPSVRRLAMELGIHFNTVADAYRLLAGEGWIDLKHGRSARVIDRHLPIPNRTALRTWRSRLKQLTAQMLAEGLPKADVASELRKIATELIA